MELRSILATDCGSTTTKAILIQKIDGEYRLTHRGEAPTTVEARAQDRQTQAHSTALLACR